MSATSSSRSPLARLVIFIVCLALAGCILASVHYLAIDLPAQKNVQAPDNAQYSKSNCDLCRNNCKIDSDYFFCLAICNDLECSGGV